MKTQYWTLAILCLAFSGIIALSILKVPIPKESDCVVVSGIVTDIYEAGTRDVVFKLQDHNNLFYVNRGLERGLDISQLKAELLHKEITIKRPRNLFIVFDHISKIEAGQRTIFTELTN